VLLSFSSATLLFAAILTLSGVWAQIRVTSYCMDAEDAVKDGKLTHDQASFRMRLMKQAGIWLTVLGTALLLIGTYIGE